MINENRIYTDYPDDADFYHKTLPYKTGLHELLFVWMNGAWQRSHINLETLRGKKYKKKQKEPQIPHGAQRP